MAHKTVLQVKERAQHHLGDEAGDVFTPQTLHAAFETAWEDLYEFLALHQLPAVEVIVEKALAAWATSYGITDTEISNYGGLVRLECKPQGAGADQYTGVVPTTVLPDTTQGDRLYIYELRGETLYFVGATQALDLRITYTATGNAPNDDSASVTFAGAHGYLAWRTAAVAGPPKGYMEQARVCNAEAESALQRILKRGVRDLQKTPIQMPAYSVNNTNLTTEAYRPIVVESPAGVSLDELIPAVELY